MLIGLIYRALDPKGQEVSGVSLALTRLEALRELEDLGLTVFALEEQNSNARAHWLTRDIQLFRTGLSNDEMAELARLLSALLGGGHTLSSSLLMASDIHSSAKMKPLLTRVEREVSSGKKPEDAFGSVGKFPLEFLVFVGAGGTSNQMVTSFDQAATFFAQRRDVRAKFLAAIAYPALLFVVGLAVAALLVLYLAPTIGGTIAVSGQHPEGALGTMLELNAWAREYMPWSLWAILLVLLVGPVTFLAMMRAVLMRIPYVRRNLAAVDYARTGRVLSALLKSGRALQEALVECQSIASPRQRELLKDAVERLSKGEQSFLSFQGDPCVPPAFSRLFSVGEQSNDLANSLILASQVLEEQNRQFMTRAVAVVSPALTLVVGAGVGYLVYVVIASVLQVSDIATL